eukprot:1314368-Amorphochlora_amoeboformis.AAC.2
MSFEGWGSQWNRIKTLAQDTDWKKMAENAVKRVGTGIDRAIGVPDEVACPLVLHCSVLPCAVFEDMPAFSKKKHSMFLF